MFKFLLSKIFGDEKSRLLKKIETKRKEALNLQRNGNIRQYSVVMTEIDEMEQEYDRLQDR